MSANRADQQCIASVREMNKTNANQYIREVKSPGITNR